MTSDPQAITEEVLRARSRRPGGVDLSAHTPLDAVVDSLGLITVVLDLEVRFGRPVLDVTKVGTLRTVRDLVDAVRAGALR